MDVDKRDKPKFVMDCSLRFSLKNDVTGSIIQEGEAKAVLDEETLSILAGYGASISFSFRDILEITEGDYRIELRLVSSETLTMSHLVNRYEPFLKALKDLRNEMGLQDMLMREPLKKAGVKATLTPCDADGETGPPEQCEVRLYETGIVLMRERGDITRIPYGDVSKVEEGEFSLSVLTDFGEGFSLSRMGPELGPFKKVLSESIGGIILSTQAYLRDIAPEASPATIRNVSYLMKDGRAVKKADIDALCPEIWMELERKLETAGIREEYDFLRALAGSDPYIGLKRGLLGEMSGDYVWFLIPLLGSSPGDPGNAIAMEAAGEDTGRATYFFRILPRGEYRDLQDIGGFGKRVHDAVTNINRCMSAINFRREPIYLPKERLREPRYLRYLFSLGRLPALQVLRDLFIGRVSHFSWEQWERDVRDLLRFNVTAETDDVKWRKGIPEEQSKG